MYTTAGHLMTMTFFSDSTIEDHDFSIHCYRVYIAQYVAGAERDPI